MTKKFLSLLLLGLLCSVGNVWGQTLIEIDDMETTSGSGSSLTISGFSKNDCTISQSSEARTGSYSLKSEYNGTGDKAVKTTNASMSVAKNSYLHVIGYAKMESSDGTSEGTGNQAAGNSYVGGNGKGTYVNLKANSWTQFTSLKKASSDQSSCYVLLQRKHSAKKAVLFDDVVIYVSTNAETDIVAPSSAESADATISEITWACGTDANTGIQNTLIWKRTSGSSNDLTLNNQGKYSVSNIDQSGHWTLISASVAADATSYPGTFTSGDVYAIVHRDLAYNYSTPTYVTIPASGAYTITKGSPIGGTFSTSKTSADEGDEITLTATPNDGYSFTSWIVTKDEDESDVTGGVVVGNTLIMPDYNVTVNATFTAIEYIITHAAVEHGFYTIKVPGRSAVDVNTTANVGQTIVLAAEPEDGYYLSSWSVTKTIGGSAVSMANENTFVMPAEDVTVAPTFLRLTCATPSISPADGSSFSGASQEITLACATVDATIHYTLDGSTPTALSDTYDPEDKPVISSTTTIKAIAVKGGYVNSDVASATITKLIENVVASWDFTNEISSTDLANLEADETNWTAPTGSELRWLNKTEISGGTVVSANSITLQEFNGITFGGNIAAGNFRWMPGNGTGNGYLQINGNNYYVTIPNLAVGDIITMSYKAAGSGDRYMTADKAELTSGTGSNVSNTGSSTDPVTPSWRVTTAGAVKFTQNKGLQIYSITVTSNVETVPVTKRDDRTYGTFVAPCGLDFSGVANMEAYIAKAINGTTSVSISKVTKVPAGTAFIVKTANPTVDLANVPVTTSATASDVEGNLLVAGNGATANSDYYYLAGDEFHLATEGTLQAGKAYLPAGAVGAPGLLRIVEGEQNATDIQSIESADKAVKFIENGRILILRDGITYDALGRIVK